MVVQTISISELVVKIEDLRQGLHGYFAHSPQCQLEFQRVVETLDSKGLKNSKNVTTWWISNAIPL